MEEKIRLSGIASELGLSTAAVSYVLHGKTGMVSERTAIRVRRALEEWGYLPRAALDAIAKIRSGEPAEPFITLSTSLVIRNSTGNC